jgi:hypothetical protein
MWQDYQPLNYTSHMNQKERPVSSIVMVEGVKPRRELMFLLSPFGLPDSFPDALYINNLGCYCRMCCLKCIPNYSSICKLTGDIGITRQINC